MKSDKEKQDDARQTLNGVETNCGRTDSADYSAALRPVITIAIDGVVD